MCTLCTLGIAGMSKYGRTRCTCPSHQCHQWISQTINQPNQNVNTFCRSILVVCTWKLQENSIVWNAVQGRALFCNDRDVLPITWLWMIWIIVTTISAESREPGGARLRSNAKWAEEGATTDEKRKQRSGGLRAAIWFCDAGAKVVEAWRLRFGASSCRFRKPSVEVARPAFPRMVFGTGELTVERACHDGWQTEATIRKLEGCKAGFC